MAKSLKSAGLEELAALKRRVTRQLALKRIARPDHDDLVEHIDAIEARIVEMREEGEEDYT